MRIYKMVASFEVAEIQIKNEVDCKKNKIL